MSDTKIRLVIADDHAVLRAGVRLLLTGELDMDVIGEAGDGTEAVELCRSLEPDVAICDYSMPDGGTSVISGIREASPDTRILVLTMHDDQSHLKRALSAGAAGYLVKKAADSELISAVRAVSEGRSFVGLSIEQGTLQQLLDDDHAAVEGTRLSEREQQVLHMVALGHTNREVAEKLGVSVKTIETYRARLSEKLGFRSRVDLVRYAIQQGLLEPEE